MQRELNQLSQLLHVATLGKTVGLNGNMKLHIQSDFPEQFKSGATFYINPTTSITLENVNLARGLVRLQGCTTPETATRYVNSKLYTTLEATRQNCDLQAGEYFWFDIEGCDVYEGDIRLGQVHDIDRIGVQDYLLITTDEALVEQGESKTFLLPYQPPFIVSTDIAAKRIIVAGGFDLLQAS
jgi:16S rRNA processing protein RimM